MIVSSSIASLSSASYSHSDNEYVSGFPEKKEWHSDRCFSPVTIGDVTINMG